MNTITRLSAPLLPLLLTACAATAPPARDFPAGVRSPSAAALQRGKSTRTPMPDGSTARADYAAEGNHLTI